MKTFVSALCLLLSCSAFAKIDLSKSVSLDRIQIDGLVSNYQGNVAIVDDQSGEKMIRVQMSVVCKEAQPCPKFIQMLEAKLLSVSTNECNQIKYVGETNLIAVDGAKTDIDISDNTGNTCREFVYPVEVHATTVAARSQVLTSYFMAHTLGHDLPIETSYIDFSNPQLLRLVIVNQQVLKGARGSVQIVNDDVTIKYVDAKNQTNVITATLEKKAVDACGAVIYSADNGKKLGVGKSFTIIDNSHFSCESVAPVRKIEIRGQTHVVYPNAPTTTYEFAQ